MPKGYSLDAMASQFFPCAKNGLSSQNLNQYGGPDEYGIYFQPLNANATPERNYPVLSAGTLEVLPSVGTVMQRYTTYNNNMDFYIRNNYNNVWSPWQKFVNIDVVMGLVYPVGAIYLSTIAGFNPNNSLNFPGTWQQIQDGRTLRASTGNAGQGVGDVGGGDLVTLSAGHLPPHAHSIPDHAHTITHTHSTPAHTHSATTTIGDGGAHQHGSGITTNQGLYGNNPIANHTALSTANSSLNVEALTSPVGNHSHGATTTIGSTAFTTDGPNTNFSGSVVGQNTGNGPGSAASFNVSGAVRYVAVWHRVG